MLRYKKGAVSADGQKVSVTYRDFRVFGDIGRDTLRGMDSMNCDLRDGILKTGLGVLPYTLKDGSKPSFASLTSRVDGLFSIDVMSSPSAAVYDAVSGNVAQAKQLLPVKEGERGIRQSDAVFHHPRQLPETGTV